MTRPTELRALTGARGIAAWWVVLYHIRLSIAGLPPAALAVFGRGYLAVDFFFLLSGFVIELSWGERLRAERWAAVPRFLLKRVARVWPLHLLMLAVATALALALAATGRADPRFPFGELPLHLLLVQNWGLTDALNWNVPAWSISAELGAYLLFPLLAIEAPWRRWPTIALVAVAAGLFAALHLAMRQAGATGLGYDIARFGLLRCLCEFGAGTVLCELWRRWRDRPALPAITAALVSAAALAGYVAGSVPETLAFPPAFAALLLLLALTARWRRNPFAAAPLHLLGEISYATYLCHFLLFMVAKLAFVDDAEAVPPVLIGLYLLLTLGFSLALYPLVERPAQAWVERLPERLHRRRALLPAE